MHFTLEGITVGRAGALRLDISHLVLDQRPTLLLGVNGAGKSTLMRILGGSTKKLSGEITRAGRVAFVEQKFRPVYGFTAQEYCAYVAWLKGQQRSVAQREADRWLSFVGLHSQSGQRCETLSGGQQARLAIATALNSGADFLVLDEPGASLDVIAKEELRSIYARISEAGQGLLVSTHEASELAPPFERVLVLDKGQLRFDGTPEEFLSLGSSSSSEIADLARAFSQVRRQN